MSTLRAAAIIFLSVVCFVERPNSDWRRGLQTQLVPRTALLRWQFRLVSSSFGSKFSVGFPPVAPTLGVVDCHAGEELHWCV